MRTSRKLSVRLVGFLLLVALFAISQVAFARCENSLNLKDIVTLEICASGKTCVEARTVLEEYMLAAGKKAADNTIVLSVHASPWRLYDASMRIISIEELAANLKASLVGKKRIFLMASWTGVAPDSNSKSIAQNLSDALGGFPVTGMDGFLWMAKDGTLRTTHQAFTVIKPKSPYMIHPNDEVMVSLVPGWIVLFEDEFIKKRNPEAMRRAAAGWDIFMLCPDRALESFKAAAQLSDPIAAYNVAMILLKSSKESDLDAAIKFLSQAAKLGDKPAQSRLTELTRQRHGSTTEKSK